MSESKSKDITDVLAKDVAEIKSALSDMAHDLQNLVADKYNQLTDKYSESLESVSEYASEQPLKTLGIALVVGFVLGFCSRK